LLQFFLKISFLMAQELLFIGEPPPERFGHPLTIKGLGAPGMGGQNNGRFVLGDKMAETRKSDR